MRIIHLTILYAGLLFFTVQSISQKPIVIREGFSLHDAWLIHLSDNVFPVIRGGDSSYFSSKTRWVTGTASSDFMIVTEQFSLLYGSKKGD